ncbi:60S ribosomal protein L19-like [Tubulinosema ratisbonensis]|uniref:60S ribosomal protein L19-like n=1 Tax=Tubulinosema ratisbonensis TaxID=291195 RepID=A0A437AHV9_9MICR|nr:60S ribosomal protein L19-like [Tubulinosema ratisbonensis]
MTKLIHHRRLAADILDCGENRVWLDPVELTRLAGAATRVEVRKLIKDGVIIKKPVAVHSRYRANKLKEAKLKGRHCGPGKVRGTKNARMPEKEIWMKKIRGQRSVLKDLKDKKMLTNEEYRTYYLQAKGNAFKSVKVMNESIEKKKAEKLRIQELASQAAALKMRK